jgi:hypothetical protein
VAFHVEISMGFRQRARAFNLDEGRLRSEILEPWVSGRLIRLGDKDWQPRDSKLIVLEGPELADADLSMGRGWANAEKASQNVTRQLVESAAGRGAAAPQVAVLAEDGALRSTVEEILVRLGLKTVSWAELRARILGRSPAAGGPGYAAVVAVAADPAGVWWFDAGLAVGALGAKAVLVQLGEAHTPSRLSGVEVLRLDPGDDASAQVLRDRLVG